MQEIELIPWLYAMASAQSKDSDWGIIAFFTSSVVGENLVAPLHHKIFLANCMCPGNFGQEQANSDNVTCKILEKQPQFGNGPVSWSERKNPVLDMGITNFLGNIQVSTNPNRQPSRAPTSVPRCLRPRQPRRPPLPPRCQ